MSDRARDILARVLLSHDEEENDPAQRPKPMQARALRDMSGETLRKNPFGPGDIVEQVPEYRLYNYPKAGALALVTQTEGLLPKAVSDEKYSREDMVILCPVRGHWVEFAVESWRFRKYEGPIEE